MRALIPIFLFSSLISALGGNWFCWDSYNVDYWDSWDCINQLWWAMRADMVENHVWWPNGFSVTWTWYCSDNPSGKTNTYGGWVWAKNSWDDTQNAWDGMEAIIEACEGTPITGGILNAYPGGEYDWGNAHYEMEWWNVQCNSCTDKKRGARRDISDRELAFTPLTVTLAEKNRTLVPGETYQHNLRAPDGTVTIVEKFLVLEDGGFKDLM